MFLESLIETSRDTRARRGFATFVSFALEGVAVGALVLVPLIYTQALPGLRFGEPVPPPPSAPRPNTLGKVRTTLVKVPPELQNDGVIHEPTLIPRGIPKGPDPVPPQVGDGEDECVGCVPFGTGDRNATARNNWVADLFKPPTVTAMARDTMPKMLRISRMDPGMLIHRVDPQYPPIAKMTRTQGEVVLAAVIGRDGRIENLRAVSGHPYLVGAAVNAVQQWRYRPTMLNGQPVEVETQVTVRFTLAQ
jgi:protein TonB